MTTFTQPWSVAIKKGRFATITCPRAVGTGLRLLRRQDHAELPGLHDDVVRPAFGRALGRIEEGDKSVDQARSEAVGEVKRAPGKQTK